MDLVQNITLILHLIGFASLLGGFLGQMKDLKNGGQIVPGMLHGSILLLVTGFALVGFVEMSGTEHVNNVAMFAKLLIVVVIFLLVLGFNKKDLSTKKWVVPVIGLLAIVNVCIAILGPIVLDGAAHGA
jgi:amino acid transporter